jgi:DNA-binding response OmpR family regulator
MSTSDHATTPSSGEGAGAKLLVVEDDTLIAGSLARALTSRGYATSIAATIAEAEELIAHQPPDLVLLDLGLPDGDGIDLASRVVSRHPDLPIIAVTARADELDVVIGLEAGTVDYVTKPFRLAELLARISAHLRLVGGRRLETGRVATRREVGDLIVDTAARIVTVAGSEISLRPREFDLLERLAREPGTVLRREQLIDEVWDENWWGSTRTLDVHVNSLRRKLGDRPGLPSRITTVRGVGYRLEPTAQEGPRSTCADGSSSP